MTQINIVIVSVAALVGLVGLATYRLFYHPLAAFPGPKLSALTKMYEAYFDLCYSYGGQFTNEVKRMHKIYGPIVRINPNEISINDPEFYEILYAPQPAIRDKFKATAAILGTTSGAFGTVDHFQHRKRRAAKSSFFSPQNVAGTEPLIKKHVEVLCNLLHLGGPKVWETRVFFMALKLDVFFDWAFADSFGLLNDPVAAQQWDDTMEAISIVAPYAKLLPGLCAYSMHVPLRLVEILTPSLARVIRLNRVSICRSVRFPRPLL